MTEPIAPSHPAPRVSRLQAVCRVFAGMAAAGVVIGALWAWIAPPAHGVVALTRSNERIFTYLGSEADHQFVATFLALAMPAVFAVAAAVLVWQWREHRGPVMVVAVSLGAGAASAVTAGIGAVLAHLRYGAIDIAGAPVSAQHRIHYVAEAPPVFFGHSPWQIAATILVPAAIGALVYALLAVATERDDLGAYPPFDARAVGSMAPVVVPPPPVS